MIPKYFATLAAVVFLVTLAASSLPFATRSQVLCGNSVEETWQLEFTIDADSGHTYAINPRLKQFLEENISFYTDGPARVASAKVDVTPKDVSWSENKKRITSKGGALAARLQWDTAADSANGAHSNIFLKFPGIPWLEGKTASFHSGGFQIDDQGRNIIREVTTYRNTFLLSLGRFIFSLSAGLPFGILLHTLLWAFVLKGEKRLRVAELPSNGPGWPQTFYPDPIAEWIIWLIVLGIGAFVASMMSGFSVYDGFMSSSFVHFVYGILATVTALALLSVYFTRRSLLTVRVDGSGITYARGRGDDLQWLNAAWGDILLFTRKSQTSRGNTTYWMELEFQDKRKKLKIGQSIRGYSTLRDILSGMFNA